MDEQILQAIEDVQNELKRAKYSHTLDFECQKCGKNNVEDIYLDDFIDMPSLNFNLNLIIDKIKLIIERENIQNNLF